MPPLNGGRRGFAPWLYTWSRGLPREKRPWFRSSVPFLSGMATAGTIIWTTPPQLLTPVGVENHAEEPFSTIQIPAAATPPSRRPWFTLTAFQACQVCSTPPLPFCQKPHCAIAFTHTHLVLSFAFASPSPLVGPFILAPEPQGTPQTAHQGPFAFASPVCTLASVSMYCERDRCLFV